MLRVRCVSWKNAGVRAPSDQQAGSGGGLLQSLG